MYLESIDRNLIIIGFYQLLLFAFLLLFFGQSKTTSKKILAVFFLNAWIYYLTLGMYYLENYEASILLYHLFVPAILAICPLFYLYVVSLTQQEFTFNSKKLIHFIPALVFFLLNTPVFAILTPEQSKWFIINGFNEIGSNKLLAYISYIYFIWNYGVFALQIVFYIYLIGKELFYHKQKIKELFSNLHQKSLNWLIWCTGLFFILLLINNTLLQTDAVDDIYVRIAYNVAMIVITAFLGFAGLQQIDIYQGISDDDIFYIDDNLVFEKENLNKENKPTNVHTKGGSSSKYKKSALSDIEKENIVNILGGLMLTKKLYLNPDLKMTDIAAEISLPRKHISQVINEKMNDNFYHYVNRYRISEAKRLLKNPENIRFSIEGIAHQSGFNSRSSFYTAFKNETGVTPSRFLKE